MTIQPLRTMQSRGFTLIACLSLAIGFAATGRAGAAQAQQNPPPKNGAPTLQPAAPGAAGAPAVKLDPMEEAAYKAFYATDSQDADKKIQLGEDFVQKYPTSRYDESVYAALVQAYLAKQNWDKFYATADKALALNPDDASVLTTVGWVIPHTYNPNDLNAQKNLDKAETYEKHGIDILGTMAKPANLTDDQFATSKAEGLAEAHSGLGLVYFRRQQFDESAKELKQAVAASTHPDPTDYYILGVDLQNLKSNAEAADAYDHCAQLGGGLQPECKKRADAARQAK